MLQRLVDQGKRLVVIEHDRPVLSLSKDDQDRRLDLGPEGGVRDGEIVAEGTPENVVMVKQSFTGQYLAPLLSRRAGEVR